MGKDCGSWHYQQHPPWQSSNLDRLSTPLDPGSKDIFMGCTDNYMVSANGTLPGLNLGQGSEPHGWFYCLPSHLWPTSTPYLNSFTDENFSATPYGCGLEATPNAVSGLTEKRFFVFNQSGDRTNLIFSSASGSPSHYPIDGIRKPIGTCGLRGNELEANGNQIYLSSPVVSDESNENHKSSEGSEMHEDTEELDALLYSDDDSNYSGEDDETSTGHSPNAVGEFEKQDELEGSTEEEEVASSGGGPIKRRRLLDGEYNGSSLVDTASSLKLNRANEYDDDDAESSCAQGMVLGGETRALSGSERFRKERIRETLNILQKIVPGGEGMDATLLLDEAIRYLRSLKDKVQTLGATSTI